MKTAEAVKLSSRNGGREKATLKESRVGIPPIETQVAKITIVGDSPLICHRWSEKARTAIEDKQSKKAKGAREARNPQAEYEAAFYKDQDGHYGFPVTAFKQAAVDACSHADGVTKVQARGAFHIVGDIAKIEGEPAMRTDFVRVGMGSADLRYRPEFKQWKLALYIRYNPNVLSLEQIVNLMNIAGFSIGVGDWRPQKDGSNGMFHVGE